MFQCIASVEPRPPFPVEGGSGYEAKLGTDVHSEMTKAVCLILTTDIDCVCVEILTVDRKIFAVKNFRQLLGR